MNKNVARIVLLTAGLIWGAGFIINKLVLDSGWNETQLLFVRFFTAFVVMSSLYHKRLIAYFRQQKKYRKVNNEFDYYLLKRGLFLGVLLFGGFYFQTLGLVYTTPSNNALITAGYIILMPAVVFLMERRLVPMKTIFAAIIILIGITVLSVNFEELGRINKGDLFTLVSTVFYAFHIYFLGKLTKKVDLFILTVFQFFMFSAIAFIAMMFSGGLPSVDFSSFNGVYFLFLAVVIGLLGSFIGFLFQSIGQKHTTEAEAAILISSESLFGPMFGIFIYGDLITVNLIIGMVLILSGIILSELDDSIFRKGRLKELS
jgi:drug/metabolite transporter (DMT)-like permease